MNYLRNFVRLDAMKNSKHKSPADIGEAPSAGLLVCLYQYLFIYAAARVLLETAIFQ